MALALAVLLAGCAGGSDATRPTATRPTTTSTTDRPTGAGGPSTTSSTAPTGPATTVLAPAGRPSATIRPGPSPTPPSPTATRPGPPGAAAARFLRGPAPLTVEVLVQAGAAPRRATLDHLLTVLRQASGRAVVAVDGPRPAGRTVWSDDDVRTAAGAPGPDVVRLLFLRGRSAAGEDVLGVTVQENAAAVFVDRVRAAASPLVGEAGLEDAVTMHELGHLLGLVELVVRSGRQDPGHPGHSRSRNSVMYWAVESDVVGAVLGGGPPVDFDDDDRAELARIRRG